MSWNWLPKQKCENIKFDNERTLIVGPSFSGETFLIFKNEKVTSNIFFTTNTSSEQYYVGMVEKISIDAEIEGLIDFENGILVFTDVLDYNQKAIGPFFTRGCHMDLDVFCFSHSFFNLRIRTTKG